MKIDVNGRSYYQDSTGKLVPEDLMKPQDIVRDDLVTDLVTRYLACLEQVKLVKLEMENAIDEYRDTVMLQHGVEPRTRKEGSRAMTLTSFDGRYRIVIAANTLIEFDEDIAAAKRLLDDYLDDELQSSNASSGLKALVESAFRMKQGQMDVRAILSLTRLDIKDEKFQKAVAIIRESMVARQATPSMRVYVRERNGEYRYQELNFSTLETISPTTIGRDDG